MNIRTAILKAADSIEQNPKMFWFSSISTPDCGTPGCALGWVAYHIGEGVLCGNSWDPWKLGRRLGILENGKYMAGIGFYHRMDKLHGGYDWKDSAPECAKALRLYADKYHPAETKPDHKRCHKALISSQWSDCEFNPMVKIER